MDPQAQQPQLPQSGGVIVKNQDGSTQNVPYSQLEQYDPFLYKQYIEGLGQPSANLQQTQAAIPGTEAQSQKAQVQATQAQAPFSITNDLKQGSSLS